MAQYRAPTADQPHAIIKFRRHYDFHAGDSLGEELAVNETWALRASDSSESAQAPRTDSVLVHPGQQKLEVSAIFSHVVSRTVQESYSCGTYNSPRTCTRSRVQNDTVVDAACHEQLGLDVEEGRLHLLQLDFQDANNCSVHCFVQTPTSNGGFKNTPCPVFPLEE